MQALEKGFKSCLPIETLQKAVRDDTVFLKILRKKSKLEKNQDSDSIELKKEFNKIDANHKLVLDYQTLLRIQKGISLTCLQLLPALQITQEQMKNFKLDFDSIIDIVELYLKTIYQYVNVQHDMFYEYVYINGKQMYKRPTYP